MNLKNWRLLTVFVLALSLIAAACGGDDEGGDFKAAFIMVAPVGDAGWNFMHNEGRLAAEENTGVETAFVDAIPEGGAEFDNAVQQFIDDGFDLIVGTSFGYQDSMLEFANNNPEVMFEHVSGYLMNDTNMGNTFGRMYQPRYIAGMAAGAATTSNRVGYVAAFPIPEVIRGINAFALGVARTNPDAVVEVAWTSTWFDPGVEGNFAQSLIDNGADVLTMHQDSTAPGQAITDAGGTFIGYHSDMSAQVDAYLTAPVWNWENRYTDIIEAAKDGNFAPESWWGGMADGVVDIEIPSSSAVAAEMQQIKDDIIAGTFDVWDQGTITAQDGTVIFEDGVIVNGWPDAFDEEATVGTPGEAINDGHLLGMNFFVSNVVGSLG
ncbi:MAG: BMP family ABC transporter substrate-binding protein [Acidimicrobiia bacterium]|nr:BMP family ABC transporter substrate-binding protein [Acidimicrobiia bacterium]